MDSMITRRDAIAAVGSVGLGALLAACSGRTNDAPATGATTVPTTDGSTATVSPQRSTDLSELFDDSASCALTPEETEGPYYFDVDAVRSDIREDRDGVPLRLAVRVQDAECSPIANAAVDIWHCDAVGTYSGFESATAGPGGGGGGPTDDETYLRGVQVTNTDGIVEFLTIYPGWYRGRTVHIHAKVHLDRSTLLTTQFFVDESVTDAVYARQPYAQRGQRETLNATDNIYDDRLGLTLVKDADGYLGLITLTSKRCNEPQLGS